MNWKKKLWDWRKPLACIGIISGVLIGLIVGFKTSSIGWGSISGMLIAVLPNVLTIYEVGKGIYRVIRLGLIQAEISQQEKQRRIQRLLQLDKSQRDNIDGYFKSSVESVSCKGLTTTAPHVILQVKFFNLSVVESKITNWKLRIERPDDYQMNCMGKSCQLRPQGGDLGTKINACESKIIDVRLEIPEAVAELIKESGNNRNPIHFYMHVDWQTELEEIRTHIYRDYLQYSGLPNLNV
jgi:hypothetical protein